MAARRWENPVTGRYYEVRITRDLWDGWEIMRTWGRVGAAHGGQMRQPKAGELACADALAEIARRRQARGYVPVQ